MKKEIFYLTARKKLTKTGPCIKSPFNGVNGLTPYLPSPNHYDKMKMSGKM
jgi:hypothetical protein